MRLQNRNSISLKKSYRLVDFLDLLWLCIGQIDDFEN